MALVSAKLTLHKQTIQDAIQQLRRCKDPRAQAALALAQDGSIFPLDEKEMKPFRGNKKKPFSDDEWETPLLYGSTDSPFQTPPDIANTQKMLITDLGKNNRFRFAPSRGNFALDAQAASQLLHNIHQPMYNERGAIINLRSPAFDNLSTNKPEWDVDGVLGQSDMHMTVTPAHEVLDLAYHDYFLLSTLVSGSKIWIVYPPSQNNCADLMQAYDKLRGAVFGSVFLELQDTEGLEHGIVIVQQAGQMLMLPPFWSSIVFCPETTVSGSYLITTALKFHERLAHIELYAGVLRIWPDAATQQRELIRYLETMAVHLAMVLGEKVQYQDAINVIKNTCAAWRSYHVQFAELCRSIGNPEGRDRVARIAFVAWSKFLDDRRKKKPICRLCYARIEHMPQEEGEEIIRILQRHFLADHWEKAVDKAAKKE